MSTTPGPHPHVIRAARRCERPNCGALIVFVRLETGKAMPVNVDVDPAGTVAVHVTGTGAIRGRVLSGERPEAEGTERLHVVHQATCGKAITEPRKSDGVVPLYRARAKRNAARGRPQLQRPDGGLW